MRNEIGFICKKCSNPAPVGIGYTDNTPGAAAASKKITACVCGYSQTPTK